MKRQDAINVLKALIEQTMAAGLFKKVADLQYALRALRVLSSDPDPDLEMTPE